MPLERIWRSSFKLARHCRAALCIPVCSLDHLCWIGPAVREVTCHEHEPHVKRQPSLLFFVPAALPTPVLYPIPERKREVLVAKQGRMNWRMVTVRRQILHLFKLADATATSES